MNLTLLGILLLITAIAYQVGLSRSRKMAGQVKTGTLHSRPGYYGFLVALWCGVPALSILLIWSLAEPHVIRQLILGSLPVEQTASMTSVQLEVLIDRLKNIASGYGVVGTPLAYEVTAANVLKQIQTISLLAKITVVFSAALVGLIYARNKISAQLRARNHVETALKIALALCSSVAILTTLGIVMSMVGEAMRFFHFVSPSEFFFGTTWNPGFSTTGTTQGEYGLLPLLWGTFMVSIIAMLVAVPVGLMAAIYMAEYATPRVRSIAKPMLETLAGIPTIVYGVFAIMFVGPMLSAFGDLIGIHINATSALTAGLVVGIMIIPFVSSLSDDIIIQVPRAMRDGSLGLGATKSETIKQVVLPAALPGIMGAFLLAISRAIGETMIVVLAAGNSPVLHANPFEAVSTVTVTIVNQLTGDTDFASPQALVAFALGLTLFVITLGLNIIALYIVRKYREQYE
ncbi:MAG: phosphate ABC transporter permease subunit PstC [Moraxellaceae bacterium]|nr:MAG: phosphate ABC transporter permease subunit PstC [Moraxellaceae bacterium]